MKISDRDLKAAAELEDIALLAKQICQDIRKGSPGGAYPLIYWLRWRLTKIIQGLGGVGVPAAPYGPAAIEAIYQEILEEEV